MLQIRRGNTEPGPNDLEQYQLGFSKQSDGLYIGPTPTLLNPEKLYSTYLPYEDIQTSNDGILTKRKAQHDLYISTMTSNGQWFEFSVDGMLRIRVKKEYDSSHDQTVRVYPYTLDSSKLSTLSSNCKFKHYQDLHGNYQIGKTNHDWLTLPTSFNDGSAYDLISQKRNTPTGTGQDAVFNEDSRCLIEMIGNPHSTDPEQTHWWTFFIQGFSGWDAGGTWTALSGIKRQY